MSRRQHASDKSSASSYYIWDLRCPVTYFVWNVHIFRQVKRKECEIRKGGPSSCCLFSVVFKYLGHAFRDENDTVTLFYIVRALTFNVDTKNSSNPSSKVDKLQMSYVFYISLFSRSAFMESSKHILKSLLSDSQKEVNLIDRRASIVFGSVLFRCHFWHRS